jgi:hypothetical protein
LNSCMTRSTVSFWGSDSRGAIAQLLFGQVRREKRRSD